MSHVSELKRDIGKLHVQDVPENVECANVTWHVFVSDAEKNFLRFLQRKVVSREHFWQRKNNVV
jgi:hypothetical protein